MVKTNSLTLSERYAGLCVRYRYILIVLLLSAGIISLFYLNNLNNDLKSSYFSYLKTNKPEKVANISETSQMQNVMVWGINVKKGDIFQAWFVNMLKDFYDEVSALSYAKPAQFISMVSPSIKYMTRNEDNNLVFRNLVPRDGISKQPAIAHQQVNEIKTGLHSYPAMEMLLIAYQNNQGEKCDVIAENGRITLESTQFTYEQCVAKSAFIIGEFKNEVKNDYLAWIKAVDELTQKYQKIYADKVHIYVSGEPYFIGAMLDELNKKWSLLAVNAIFIFLALLLFLQSFKYAFLILLVTGNLAVMLFVLAGLFQIEFNSVLIVFIAIVTVICIGQSIQAAGCFFDEYKQDKDKLIAAHISISTCIVPAGLSYVIILFSFLVLCSLVFNLKLTYILMGLFSMLILLLNASTLLPLLLSIFPPSKLKPDMQMSRVKGFSENLISGKLNWFFVSVVITGIVLSVYFTKIHTGIQTLLMSENQAISIEQQQIKDEFDFMPGVQKGVHIARAAFKDHSLFSEIIYGDGNVAITKNLVKLSSIMPGVITTNLQIKSLAGVKPECGADAFDNDGVRIISADICYDFDDDLPQGIYNNASVLVALDNFETWLRAQQEVGFTLSYIQFLKNINMLVLAPDVTDKRINLYEIPGYENIRKNWNYYRDPEDSDYTPDPDRTIQFYNGVVEATGIGGVMDQFVNTHTWDDGLISIFIKEMDPLSTHKLVMKIRQYLINHQFDKGMDLLDFKFITSNSNAEIPDAGGFPGVSELARQQNLHIWLKLPLTMLSALVIFSLFIMKSWRLSVFIATLLLTALFIQYGLSAYLSSIGEWSGTLTAYLIISFIVPMIVAVDLSVYLFSGIKIGLSKNAINKVLVTTISGIFSTVMVLIFGLIPLMNNNLAVLWTISLYTALALLVNFFLIILMLPFLANHKIPDKS